MQATGSFAARLRKGPFPSFARCCIGSSALAQGRAAAPLRAGGGPPQPVSCAVTDEDGQLFFGPLKAGELYLVKLFKAGGAVRQLEIAGD